jgi:hypothetical protein
MLPCTEIVVRARIAAGRLPTTEPAGTVSEFSENTATPSTSCPMEPNPAKDRDDVLTVAVPTTV